MHHHDASGLLATPWMRIGRSAFPRSFEWKLTHQGGPGVTNTEFSVSLGASYALSDAWAAEGTMDVGLVPSPAGDNAFGLSLGISDALPFVRAMHLPRQSRGQLGRDGRRLGRWYPATTVAFEF
ncbi:MAG: hypothetical protein ACLPJH_01925 [Myxococcaceae bacterium]